MVSYCTFGTYCMYTATVLVSYGIIQYCIIQRGVMLIASSGRSGSELA